MALRAILERLRSRFRGQYLYPTLPEKCYCHSCGYVLENPGKHCREIRCPRCGARMWRRPP